MTNWNELIGKRCLVNQVIGWEIFEVVVEEISPSGRFVKFTWLKTGYSTWQGVDCHHLVETLNDKKTS